MLIWLFSISLSVNGQPANHLQLNDEYFVSVDKNFDRLSVRACFAGAAPAYLAAGSRNSISFLEKVAIVEPKVLVVGGLQAGIKHTALASRLERSGKRLLTKSLPADSCIDYTVDLTKAFNSAQVKRVGPDVLLDLDTWLWQPPKSESRSGLLHFNLPVGMAVSGPWKPIYPRAAVDVKVDVKTGTYRRTSYDLGDTPVEWTGRMALGYFSEHKFKLQGTDFRLAVLGGLSPAEQQKHLRWVQQAASAVSSVYDAFPLPWAHGLVIPSGRAREAIPWAEIQRRGGVSAHFFIDASRSLDEFLSDWTPSHELSHMLHPRISRNTMWVYEGLASYYQNVARARHGSLSSQNAWLKLVQGFQRGEKAAGRSSLNHAGSNYMHTYWGGAALALFADIELRKRSGGTLSLAQVLKRFSLCCLPSDRIWSADEFFSKLDELSGELSGDRIFISLYEHYGHAYQFPNYKERLEALGISVIKNNISINNAASNSNIRKAIMGEGR